MDGLHSPGTLNSKTKFRDLRRPHSINSVSDTIGVSIFLHVKFPSFRYFQETICLIFYLQSTKRCEGKTWETLMKLGLMKVSQCYL